jgi:hypothetical protein
MHHVHPVGRLAQPVAVGVDDVDHSKPRVTVSSRIPPGLAQDVAALARAADRSVSREVERAVRDYVAAAPPSSGGRRISGAPAPSATAGDQP